MDPVGATPAVNFLLTKLWDPIAMKAGYIIDVKRNVETMIHSMNQLRDTSLDVLNRVSAAEAQLLTRTKEIDGWLRRVAELDAKVSAVEQDFLQGNKNHCSCPANLYSSYRIGRSAARRTSEVNEMLGRANFDIVATRETLEVAVELPTMAAVGIESVMEDVFRYLSDDQTRIVGIHGMGGVGKTTLLRKINNVFAERTKSEFDHVIMVEASPDFEIKQLQQVIAERVGLPLSEDAKIESRAIDIFKCLRNKKFLLLLDNLWHPINLIEAGVPTGRINKCKVVIATRFESICGQMAAEKKMRVECLPPEKAWELFRQRLGDLVVSNPEIEDLAKLVAEECHGLPLAIVVVAAAMSAKTTREEWQYAVRLMNKMHLDSLIPEKVGPFPILKLSYDSLPTDQLKLCFLSCSFYPDGHSIPKQELIECWMGLGFLEEHDDIDEDYERGHFLIGKLREASLLEPGHDEKHVKMHGTFRGLALQLTRIGLAPQNQIETTDTTSAEGSGHGLDDKYWFVQAGVGLTDVPDQYLEGSSIERMSLMHNNIDLLPKKTDFPILLSLMLQWNVSLPGILSKGFFEGMGCLRYLDLSHTSVKEVHGIDRLLFLEHLNLSDTLIHELPEELQRLRRLKYLYLVRTYNLQVIPFRLLSSLGYLRVLNMYDSAYIFFWVTDDAGSCESSSSNVSRSNLCELDGLTYLKALGISIGTHSASEKIFSMPIPTRYLYVSAIRRDNSIPFKRLQLPSTIHSRSKIDTSLLELTIRRCKDLEELMIGKESQGEFQSIHRGGGHRFCSLKGLENLHLWSLDKLSKIIWKGVTPNKYFPSIRFLSIVGCHKLRSVAWVLQLPRLEKLRISDCSGVQQVIIADEDESIVERGGPPFFPRLKTMDLINLGELTSIYQGTLAFPYLVSLHVSRCPNLMTLPFGERSGFHLQEIRGNRDWWNNLNWPNNNIEESFSRHFKEAAS